MGQFVHHFGGTKMVGHKNIKKFKLVFHQAYLTDSSKLECFNIVRAYQLYWSLALIMLWQGHFLLKWVKFILAFAGKDLVGLFHNSTQNSASHIHHLQKKYHEPRRANSLSKRFKISVIFQKIPCHSVMSADDQYNIV